MVAIVTYMAAITKNGLYLPFFHDLFGEAKRIIAKITQMGGEHELMASPFTDFIIVGDVTLDQLTGNAT